MYTGKTKKLGVIGYPVEHSLSPLIHNSYLQAKQLDYMYMSLTVEPHRLADTLKVLGEVGFVGLNVTIPHKVAVMEHLAYIDPAARAIGAVNTLVRRGDAWHGYNTDAFGFSYPLLQEKSLIGQTAVVLGCGGAARAVIYALHHLGLNRIYLAVRNHAKGMTFAADFPDFDLQVVDIHDYSGAFWNEAALIVNTTPLGMTGKNLDAMVELPWSLLNPQALIYDLIYTPAVTKLLQTAKAAGHRIINGEVMLAAQGGKALELWTENEIDIDFMADTLRNYLASRI